MLKIWHPWTVWEEVPAGMWRKAPLSEHEQFLAIAFAFTGDAKQYGAAMFRVLDLWPLSCEHNLTDIGMNRRAWIGHAACCIAINCPEYIVREAWWLLTQRQRDEADDMANQAIAIFEERHERKTCGLHSQMALPGIPQWNPGRSAGTA